MVLVGWTWKSGLETGKKRKSSTVIAEASDWLRGLLTGDKAGRAGQGKREIVGERLQTLGSRCIHGGDWVQSCAT